MPLVVMLFGFALGIGSRSLGGLEVFWIHLPWLVVGPFAHLKVRKNLSKTWESLWLISCCGLCALLGFFFLHLRLEPPGNHVLKAEGQGVHLRAHTLNASSPSAYGQKVLLEVKEDLESHCPLSGKLQTYLPAGSPLLPVGYEIEVWGKCKPLSNKFPSYRSYLEQKDIFLSLSAHDLKLLGAVDEAWAWVKRKQARLSHTIETRMPVSTSGLAKAMLLGDKSGLTKATKTHFSQAGLSHVLAISGLHVGICYVFLNHCLVFLNRLKRGTLIRTLVVLTVLLAYALLTGASPAVCRATLMFSTFSLGRLLQRQSSPLNTLAGVAFVLLVWDPKLLFDLGFQLSFLAVTGILIGVPYCERGLKRRFPYLGKTASQALSASLSAQLFTSPLIYIHFGSLPTYFLFSNLLLLPLVAWSVNLGLVALIFSQVPMVSTLLFGMLDFCLWLLAQANAWFAKLPGAIISDWSWEDPGFRGLLVQVALGIGLWYFPSLWQILKAGRKPGILIKFGHGRTKTGGT